MLGMKSYLVIFMTQRGKNETVEIEVPESITHFAAVRDYIAREVRSEYGDGAHVQEVIHPDGIEAASGRAN